MKKIIFCCVFFAFSIPSLFAQTSEQAIIKDSVKIVQPPKLRSSPMLLSFYKADDVYIKIVYGSPLKKGRKIFGDLVPYGKLWRTGPTKHQKLILQKI